MNIELIDENLIDIQLQEAALRLAKRKAKWNASRSILAGTINALVKIGVEPSFDTDYLSVSCTGDAKKLTLVMRILRTSGFAPREGVERPKKGESQWSAWFYNHQSTISIWFSFTSSVCVRVKVGTKTEIVDVYETRCGDISGEEPALLPGQSDNALGAPVNAVEYSGEESTELSDSI